MLAYCEDALDELRHTGSVLVSPEINVGQHVALAAHCCLFRLFSEISKALSVAATLSLMLCVDWGPTVLYNFTLFSVTVL